MISFHSQPPRSSRGGWGGSFDRGKKISQIDVPMVNSFANRSADRFLPLNKVGVPGFTSRRLMLFSWICGLMLLSISHGQGAEASPSIAGTWTWGPRPEPGLIRQILLRLEYKDGKLGGMLRGRGPDAVLEATRLEGNQISFEIPRVVAQKRIIQKFSGSWEGDVIRGTIQYDKDGKHEVVPWEARREPASSGTPVPPVK